MGAERLRASFEYVAQHGEEVALYFYSDLFLRNPGVRDLFPVSMATQRDRFVSALARIVASVDDLPRLTPYLQQLGRDHRRFGALEQFYAPVGTSLLATLAHFCGNAWTPDLAADWKAAYAIITRVMIDAASDDQASNPPWWEATVTAHEARSTKLAVIRVAPELPLRYLPGQSVAVESRLRPRIWRFYSMANAPREDGTLDFHIKVIDGGALSGALAMGAQPGTRLRLGAPVGTLALNARSFRDVVMLAGSTGLAPLKAIIEQIAGSGSPPRVHLFFGARTGYDLYDLPELDKMAARFEWLSVTPVVSDDPYFPGERGTVADIAARYGSWKDRDAYVCGPSAMVAASVAKLKELGMPNRQINVENFGWSQQ